MWNAVSRSYVLWENTNVPVYMYPNVKCNEAGVKGGEGRVTVNGSSSPDPAAALAIAFAVLPQLLREVWKYGDRETSMNRWEEKTAVALSWFMEEKVPVREILMSE